MPVQIGEEHPAVLRFNGRNRKMRQPPRNYFSRREQFRLMGMVFVLGFVILLAVRAADPGSWAWLLPGVNTTNKNTPETDENRAVPAAEPGAAKLEARQHPRPIPPLPLDTVRLAKDPDTAALAAGDATGYFPGVVPDHLREIRDNQPFRPEEAAAWFNLLGVLRDANPAALKRAASPVGFVQLYQQPEAYRGQLVTFDGRIRRVTWRPVGTNKEGITGYYELVLKPQTGPTRPVMAYVLNLPEKLKSLENDLDEPIQLTGFFFKNWVYAGEKATYVAPVLLARGVRWSPPAVEPPYTPAWGLIAAVGLGSALAAGALAWLGYYVSQQRSLPIPSVTPAEVEASVALMAQYDTPQDPTTDARNSRDQAT